MLPVHPFLDKQEKQSYVEIKCLQYKFSTSESVISIPLGRWFKVPTVKSGSKWGGNTVPPTFLCFPSFNFSNINIASRTSPSLGASNLPDNFKAYFVLYNDDRGLGTEKIFNTADYA